MKRVLITGGAGFVGSNLIRKLDPQTTEITVIDSLVSGSEANLFGQDVRLIKADVGNFDFSCLDKHDEIYHLACIASPQGYQKDPLHTLNTCFNGTRNTLSFALQHRSKVVFSSTSEVYGDPKESPQNECYNGNVSPVTIRSCYDEGKRVAETLCFEYQRRGLDVKIARIFNTYGPFMGENDGRVISNFITQALKGEPLTIYGSGAQTRSFCYVDDTVRGLMDLMRISSECLEVVNIGNDSEMTIKDVAEVILNLMDQKGDFEYRPLPVSDPQIRKPCLARAKRVIDWVPQVSLDQGLQLTIEYFKQLTANNSSQDFIGLCS